jgi:hypothetical protein
MLIKLKYIKKLQNLSILLKLFLFYHININSNQFKISNKCHNLFYFKLYVVLDYKIIYFH